MSGFGMFDAMEMSGVHLYEERMKTARSAAREELSQQYKSLTATKNSRKEVMAELNPRLRELLVANDLETTWTNMRRIRATFADGDYKSKTITSDWKFDETFLGWMAHEGSKDFLCSHCGRTLAELGFQTCKCGSLWNGYTVTTHGSKESSSPMIVWREVEDRSETKVASVEKTAYPDRSIELDADGVAQLEASIEDEDMELTVSEEPVYDHEMMEKTFTSGYLDAVNGVKLQDDTDPIYVSGYCAGMGIE